MTNLFLTTQTFFYPGFILLSLIKAVDFIYLFQIKEYRFDRFFSFLKEIGFVKIFYLRTPQTPGKSVRNILLMILSLILILIFPVNLISSSLGYLILIISIPILAFLFVIISVWLTSFLAAIQRNNQIDKAADKLKHSNAIVVGITGSYGKSSVK